MKQLLTLIMLVPFMLKGQTEYQHFCSYNAESTAKHILKKHIKDYLHDTVEFSVERRGYKYHKKYLNASQTEKKVLRKMKHGTCHYAGKTNSGYTFTIVIVDENDDTEILSSIKFEVDHFYQKIISVEISKGI